MSISFHPLQNAFNPLATPPMPTGMVPLTPHGPASMVTVVPTSIVPQTTYTVINPGLLQMAQVTQVVQSPTHLVFAVQATPAQVVIPLLTPAQQAALIQAQIAQEQIAQAQRQAARAQARAQQAAARNLAVLATVVRPTPRPVPSATIIVRPSHSAGAGFGAGFGAGPGVHHHHRHHHHHHRHGGF